MSPRAPAFWISFPGRIIFEVRCASQLESVTSCMHHGTFDPGMNGVAVVLRTVTAYRGYHEGQ